MTRLALGKLARAFGAVAGPVLLLDAWLPDNAGWLL